METRYLTIAEASSLSGLSKYFLRNHVRLLLEAQQAAEHPFTSPLEAPRVKQEKQSDNPNSPQVYLIQEQYLMETLLKENPPKEKEEAIDNPPEAPLDNPKEAIEEPIEEKQQPIEEATQQPIDNPSRGSDLVVEILREEMKKKDEQIDYLRKKLDEKDEQVKFILDRGFQLSAGKETPTPEPTREEAQEVIRDY